MFRRYRVRATIEAALLFSKMFFFSSSEFQSSLTQYRLERPPTTFHCFVFATCETREFSEGCAFLFFFGWVHEIPEAKSLRKSELIHRVVADVTGKYPGFLR